MEELGRLGDLGNVDAPYRSRDERRKLAARRLRTERDCWLVTSHADHGPYAVPISFLAVDSDAYLATHQSRPTVRNVAAEPRVLLVLGGHGDAVRAQGHGVVLGLAEVAPTVMGRYVDKAGWSPLEAGLCDAARVLVEHPVQPFTRGRPRSGGLAGGRPGGMVSTGQGRESRAAAVRAATGVAGEADGAALGWSSCLRQSSAQARCTKPSGLALRRWSRTCNRR